MSKKRELLIYIAIAYLLNLLSEELRSTFLDRYLQDELIATLFFLLGLNMAISFLIVSKIDPYQLENSIHIKDIQLKLKASFGRLILLIGIAVLVFIIKTGAINIPYHDIVLNTVLTTLLINAIDIIRDTGMYILFMNKQQ